MGLIPREWTTIVLVLNTLWMIAPCSTVIAAKRPTSAEVNPRLRRSAADVGEKRPLQFKVILENSGLLPVMASTPREIESY